MIGPGDYIQRRQQAQAAAQTQQQRVHDLAQRWHDDVVPQHNSFIERAVALADQLEQGEQPAAYDLSQAVAAALHLVSIAEETTAATMAACEQMALSLGETAEAIDAEVERRATVIARRRNTELVAAPRNRHMN